MSYLPTGTRILLNGFSQQDSVIIERTEMDRGPAKTRRTANDVIVTTSALLLFQTTAAIAEFRTWYYSAAGGGAGTSYWQWLDPRTRTVRNVRFVASSMGPLQPLAGASQVAQMTCAFEYLEAL